MFKIKNLFFIIILIFVSTTNISVISAISINDFGSFSNQKMFDFEYTMSPKFPQPNQLVEINLSAHLFNIDSSEIFYFINETLVRSGVGMKNFLVGAPDSGESMRITIIIRDIDQKVYKKYILIRPISSTLVYEVVDAYKPPFYQGKAYALSNSKIKFKVFSDFVDSQGNHINEDNLIYTWYVNHKIKPSVSGYGKKIFILERLDAIPIQTRVEVRVTDKNNTNQTRAALIVIPQETVVNFYQAPIVEPFLFKNILKNNTLNFSGLEGQIRAVPYFMSGITDTRKPVFYEWRLNGRKILKGRNENRNLIYIAVSPESELRRGNITLQIENKERPFQSYSGSFNISFSDINRNDRGVGNRRINISDDIRIKREQQNDSFFGLF